MNDGKPVPIIDIEQLKNRLDNDFNLFLELSSLFLNNADNLVEQLKAAINQGDIGLIKKRAHTIKGAVANFSAEQAYSTAKRIEELALNNSFTDIPVHFSQLSEEILTLKDTIRRIHTKQSFE